MRILFLSQRVPFPPNRGDKIPTYHYIRHLAQEHEVTVACLADGQRDLANVEGLRCMVHAIDAVPLSATRARIRALAALSSDRPLTVAYFDEPRLRERVLYRVKLGVDAIIVFSSGVAQFAEEFSDLPRIIQFADLDSQKWKMYAASTLPPKRWLYSIESKRLLKYERHIAATFSRSLVCSQRESADFKQLIPEASVECLQNGVDLDYFRPEPSSQIIADSVIFTGVMNYRPNVDGVTWFCREVLPRIRIAFPNVTFTICGSSPIRSVRELARLPGVTVTGGVPDVRPLMARAAVAVVPLRIARGIQNKLLEAMAMGLPCVSTTIAWAGIEAEPGRDLLVADSADAFADSVVQLLRDRRLRGQMQQAGRAAVESNHSWRLAFERLDNVIDEATRRTGRQSRHTLMASSS